MKETLKVVNIGGFGHNVCVFNEMIGFDKSYLHISYPKRAHQC